MADLWNDQLGERGGGVIQAVPIFIYLCFFSQAPLDPLLDSLFHPCPCGGPQESFNIHSARH